MQDFENIDNQLPYNPSDVDIRQQKFTVDFIMNMIANSDIELWREEDYQRKSNQWSPQQKSRLIESLIMRIPLPIFYFDGSERPWKIIDGLHRLTTLYLFLKGMSFELRELEYIKDFEGKSFFDLPFNYRRVIETATIEAYVINPGTPDKVKLNIFQRINTGGSTLSRQEIRNAYYRGKSSAFINALAEDNEFLETTRQKISQDKMRDKEVALRFFAFFKYIEQYAPPMEKFLDNSMESIDKLDGQELNDIRARFHESMIICREIFNGNAFYVLNTKGEKLGTSINIALFEVWSVNVAQLERVTINSLINQKGKVFSNFIGLLQYSEFYKSISSGTSSKKAVHTRFAAIKQLINNITNAY